jgi:4-diphosphocytidyl-2-C-methyl-D-erythritol kinase
MLLEAALTEAAPAKINLALHVTGKRGDGYHLLDSIVAFAQLGDVLHLSRADETSLEITGPFAHRLHAGDEENLVLKAVAGLKALLPDLPSVHIRLEKHLPVASGIGGGSADAAAALRGLMRLCGRRPDAPALHELALSLGADVPVCLANQTSRMRGIGEDLTPLSSLPAMPALIVNPGVPCDTRQVFHRLALGDGFSPIVDASDLKSCRNDLQAPAIAGLPVIGEVLENLASLEGAWLSRMSGSGATCFALFTTQSQAQAAAKRLRDSKPQWWVEDTIVGAGFPLSR